MYLFRARNGAKQRADFKLCDENEKVETETRGAREPKDVA